MHILLSVMIILVSTPLLAKVPNKTDVVNEFLKPKNFSSKTELRRIDFLFGQIVRNNFFDLNSSELQQLIEIKNKYCKKSLSQCYLSEFWIKQSCESTDPKNSDHILALIRGYSETITGNTELNEYTEKIIKKCPRNNPTSLLLSLDLLSMKKPFVNSNNQISNILQLLKENTSLEITLFEIFQRKMENSNQLLNNSMTEYANIFWDIAGPINFVNKDSFLNTSLNALSVFLKSAQYEKIVEKTDLILKKGLKPLKSHLTYYCVALRNLGGANKCLPFITKNFPDYKQDPMLSSEEILSDYYIEKKAPLVENHSNLLKTNIENKNMRAILNFRQAILFFFEGKYDKSLEHLNEFGKLVNANDIEKNQQYKLWRMKIFRKMKTNVEYENTSSQLLTSITSTYKADSDFYASYIYEKTLFDLQNNKTSEAQKNLLELSKLKLPQSNFYLHAEKLLKLKLNGQKSNFPTKEILNRYGTAYPFSAELIEILSQ